MVAERTQISMTVDEYLALEQHAGIKHEYVDGQVYAMSGGTLDHDRIANNLRAAIDARLGDGPCAIFGPDVRLRVSPTVYYYPDALVTCDEARSGDAIEVRSARLIVEVLSVSTEVDDRGDKFANYQAMDSCEEYLLVQSRRRTVERFRRTGSGLWIYQRYDPDMEVTLESIGLRCPVAAFYRRTSL